MKGPETKGGKGIKPQAVRIKGKIRIVGLTNPKQKRPR